MKRISAIQAGVALCLAFILGFSFWPSSPEQLEESEVNSTITSNVAPVATVENAPPTKNTIPGVTQTEQGKDFAPELKERLLTISEAYEEQIQYPSFSYPIRAEELERKYMPDVAIANELPARLSDPNSPTLAIKSTKMRYFAGDQIEAVAAIRGLSEDVSSAIIATLKADGENVSNAIVTPLPDQPHTYQLQFQTVDTEQFSAHQELTIDTEFQFQGERYQRGTSIEYVTTIASIDQVAPASIDSEYLTIPVYVSTDKPGFHRIKGNLYDAQTDQPLVHLRDEAELDSQYGTLTFKAHIAALKHAGSEGPYVLKDLSLQRLPSEPDYTTEFGRVEVSDIQIDQFSFSEYNDQPYINEKAQRIAQELRRLGS